MWKKLYHKKYFTIALYALAVIFALILLLAVSLHIDTLREVLSGILRILRPITIALVLSYFCNPMMNIGERYVFGWLDRFPRFPKIFKRIFSLLLSYLLILVLIAAVLLLTLPEIINNYATLIGNLTSFVLTAAGWADDILHLANMESLEQLVIKNSDRILAAVAPLLTDLLARVSTLAVTIVLATVLSFYMLLYKEFWTAGLKRTMAAILPRRWYAEMTETLSFANRTFGRYLLGSVFDSILVGCECFILLFVFNVPYAALVSVLVGVTNIIPYFGPFIGSIPAFFIILTQDAFKAFLFLGLILVVQQIDGNMINPRIIGKTTSVNSMLVILAITAIGGWLGIIGMVIAIPLFSVFYMLVSRFVNRRLEAKGLPTEREPYENAFSVSHYKKNEAAMPQATANNERKGGKDA